MTENGKVTHRGNIMSTCNGAMATDFRAQEGDGQGSNDRKKTTDVQGDIRTRSEGHRK